MFMCFVAQTVQQVPYFIHVDLKVGDLQQGKTHVTQVMYQYKRHEKVEGCARGEENWISDDKANHKMLCCGCVEVMKSGKSNNK